MRRMSRAAGALKTALGRRGSIRSKILAGFTVILVGMLSINLLVIGLSHHFLGEYHILAERVISANKLIPTVRDDVSLDAYYLVAGRRTLETTQLFHHMEEIRQGLSLLKQENNSENGRIQLQIATRTFGTLQRYCQKLGQEIDADVSLELQNVTLEQIRDVSALVYNQIEEYIYLELLWGESIDQMLQTGFQQQGDGGLSVGAGDADALHGLCRVPVKIASHLGQRQTVRGNQDIGGLYIRLFRRDRHNGSLFHRHGDESVPVRGKAGDGRKQAPGHCLSGIVDDGSNFRFQIGVDFCYGHAL